MAGLRLPVTARRSWGGRSSSWRTWVRRGGEESGDAAGYGDVDPGASLEGKGLEAEVVEEDGEDEAEE